MKCCAKIFALFCFAIFLLPFGVSAKMESIFYLPKYNEAKGLQSVAKNYKKIDIFAPQIYTIKSDLKLYGGPSAKMKAAIKKYKLKTMPLVANSQFIQTTIHNLLLSPDAQQKVINSLITEAKKQKFIGWQFDFENVSYLDKDLFSAFVEKAWREFKKNNLVFSVGITARANDFEDTDAFKNWTGVYDYKRISNATDFVSLLAYDDPNSQGPVASLPFTQKMLKYAENKIPNNKISLGVPLYYWKWIDSGQTPTKVGIGMFGNLLNIQASNRYVLGFDAALGVPWMSYATKTQSYKIWFENKQSFQQKLNLIQQNNLRGFSAWMLGGEDPAIWTTL